MGTVWVCLSKQPRNIEKTVLIFAKSEPFVVRETGLEPASSYEHMNLNHARLPIPPFPRNVLRCAKDWWAGVDSNHRRLCQRIYSPPPLATREPTHIWSRRRDLNPQPADYKSAALPIELHRQLAHRAKWRPGRGSNPRPPA